MIKRIIQFFQPHEWALIIFLVVMFVLLTGCATQKTAYTPFIVEMHICGELYAVIGQDVDGVIVVAKPGSLRETPEGRAWVKSAFNNTDQSRYLAKNDVDNCKGV